MWSARMSQQSLVSVAPGLQLWLKSVRKTEHINVVSGRAARQKSCKVNIMSRLFLAQEMVDGVP